MDRTMSRFVGVWMDQERAQALRIVAARKNTSVSELIRRATEVAYGDEMDTEQAGIAVPSVIKTVSKKVTR